MKLSCLVEKYYDVLIRRSVVDHSLGTLDYHFIVRFFMLYITILWQTCKGKIKSVQNPLDSTTKWNLSVIKLHYYYKVPFAFTGFRTDDNFRSLQTPEDVYNGRDKKVKTKREMIKDATLRHRRKWILNVRSQWPLSLIMNGEILS